MKTSQNNLPVRIIAGVIALILILGILFVTNAFVGNPISAMMANKSIEQYVNQNYSFLDLEVEKAIYDFKSSGYMARANSKTSIDTKFAIYYRNGKVQRDDYEDYVLGRFNTINRLSEEYSFIAKGIIAQELGFENNTTRVMFNKDEYENAKDIIELDMKFEKTLPLEAEVHLQIDLKDNTLEEVAKVLSDAHRAFEDQDCNFTQYGLYSENDDGRHVSVHGVTPKDIEGGELLSLMKKAQEREINEREAWDRESQKNVKKEIIEKEEIKDKEVVERMSVFIKE